MIGMIAHKKGLLVVDCNGNKTTYSTPNGNTLLNIKTKPL